MPEERVIWDAEFNDAVTSYWLFNGALICVVTVIGIPLLPFWILGGKWLTRKYLASHRCTLTDRSLKVSKGVFTKIEKTVPLDRITDVGIVQGPVMRHFKIESLTVETAGQSSTAGLVQLSGIKNGREFRDAVLKQRELVVGSHDKATGPVHVASPSEGGQDSTRLLTEIRDALVRIESRLNKG